MRRGRRFSTRSVELGVYFAMAYAHPYSAQSLSEDDDSNGPGKSEPGLVGLDELINLLQAQGVTTKNIEHVLAITSAGVKLVQSQPWLNLSTEEYDSAREWVLNHSNDENNNQSSVWPPSKVTVATRLGDSTWNGVLHRLGLRERNRGDGRHSWARDDFDGAMLEFVTFCLFESEPPDHATYVKWQRGDTQHPQYSAVRAHFGTWTIALSHTFSKMRIARNYTLSGSEYLSEDRDRLIRWQNLRDSEWDEDPFQDEEF